MSLPEPYYERDGVKVFCCDCRDILPQLEPVDLVVTDPPYGISKVGSEHRRRKGKGTRRLDFFPCDRDPGEVRRLVLSALSLAVVKEHASFYVWCGHRYLGDIVRWLEDTGRSTRFLVWEKPYPPPPPPGSGWPSAAEICIFGAPPHKTWTPDGAHPPASNVLHADSYRFGQPGKVDHPTQKPLGVITPLIEVSSRPGDLVLDPFMGSGTTLVAARELGRKAIGIEIEEKFCKVAADRLSQQIFPFRGALR